MALTGLQIQKLLPKTNCKECGSNTCLAFAMKLAAKQADLSMCPYASEEAKSVLGAASEPPVKCIELGSNKELRIGEETVIYRHEKTFVNQILFAVNINDDDDPEIIDKTIKSLGEYAIERVGEKLTIELVSLTQKGNDPERYAGLAKKIRENTKKPLILNCPDIKSMSLAAEAVAGSNSILASATPENAEEFKNIALRYNHSIAITAETIDELAALAERLKSDGFNNLLLNFKAYSLAEYFQISSIARRMAIKNNHKPLGYPFIAFIKQDEVYEELAYLVTGIVKYGSICVFPSLDLAQMLPLMSLRQNIYTDPQKPIQVDPKAYPIGEPDRNSPVFLTTNFSLTYFMVSSEIENSGISGWLVVPQCEGMSVLTAWAAGKLTGDQIAKAIREMNFEEQVKTREIVIPGYVAQISGELEECLPGWKVVVGPQEAADIESFVKIKYKK
jgi:acetyl-CoA decarbonylase/synthase complex subunit gamma